MTAQFDQLLASQLQAYGNDLFIESLTIDNGKIHIVAGRINLLHPIIRECSNPRRNYTISNQGGRICPTRF